MVFIAILISLKNVQVTLVDYADTVINNLLQLTLQQLQYYSRLS